MKKEKNKIELTNGNKIINVKGKERIRGMTPPPKLEKNKELDEAQEMFISKFMQGLNRILHTKFLDEMIHGNSYLEISERKIELLKPDKVDITKFKGMHTKVQSDKRKK